MTPGTVVHPDGAEFGADIDPEPVVITSVVTRFPYGIRYRATQGAHPLLITVLDARLTEDEPVRFELVRTLRTASTVKHKNLLPVRGLGRLGEHDAVFEDDPGGLTAREFVTNFAALGRPIDIRTLFVLTGHVTNALRSLHNIGSFHGYITPDTILVSNDRRVYVTSVGFGEVIARWDGITALAPEQRQLPPQLTARTDIFGVAALLVELATGRRLGYAGQRLVELGLDGPESLTHCLERATAPSPMARPPDLDAFVSELEEALESGPIRYVAFGSEATPLPSPSSPPPPRGPSRAAAPPPSPPRLPPPDPFSALTKALDRIVDLEDLENATRWVDEQRSPVPPRLPPGRHQPPPAPIRPSFDQHAIDNLDELDLGLAEPPVNHRSSAEPRLDRASPPPLRPSASSSTPLSSPAPFVAPRSPDPDVRPAFPGAAPSVPSRGRTDVLLRWVSLAVACSTVLGWLWWQHINAG